MVTTSGLAEIVLMVGDVERSRRFYEGTLGLKVISPDLGGPVHPFLPVVAIYVDDPDGNEVELVASH